MNTGGEGNYVTTRSWISGLSAGCHGPRWRPTAVSTNPLSPTLNCFTMRSSILPVGQHTERRSWNSEKTAGWGGRLRRAPLRQTTTPKMLCGTPVPYGRAARRELQLPACTAPIAAFWLAGCRDGADGGRGRRCFSCLHDNERVNKMAEAWAESWARVRSTDNTAFSASLLLLTVHGGDRGEARRGAACSFWPPARPLPGALRGARLAAQSPSPRGWRGGERRWAQGIETRGSAQSFPSSLGRGVLIGTVSFPSSSLGVVVGGKSGEVMRAKGSDFSFPQHEKRMLWCFPFFIRVPSIPTVSRKVLYCPPFSPSMNTKTN